MLNYDKLLSVCNIKQLRIVILFYLVDYKSSLADLHIPQVVLA